MIRKHTARRACLVALLVALAPAVGAIPLASGAPASAPGTQQYAVAQGGQCYTVNPVGDGSTSVTDHYDYQSPYNSEPNGFSYSSMGNTIQSDQVSNLYVYDGADGHSLVMVHDSYGDAPNGSTVSFDLSGLPTDGEWVVQDDNYPLADDDWSVEDGQASIDWFWSSGRTDGGAFLGLNDVNQSGVTISPGFNQNADQWSYWNEESPANAEMTGWALQSGDGTTHQLDMGSAITVYQGSCAQNDLTGTVNAALSGPGSTTAGTSVSFDASATDGANSYEWSFGDGASTSTENTTITHTYSSPGIYTASVTASGDATDTAFATVVVNPSSTQAPTAALSGPGFQNADDGNVYLDPNSIGTFSAAGSTDDVGIDTYTWDFGDGTTATTQTAAIPHTYSEPGNYTVTVTATDTQGATDTATLDVTVEDTLAPTASISGPTPSNVTTAEPVSFSGADSTDANELAAYNWTFGDGTNATGANVTHTYEEGGTFNVTLSVSDQAGNTQTATQTVNVTAVDTPPVANLTNPGDVEANANVTFNASASTDEGEIVSYDWDLNGDGNVDQTTEEPTLTEDLSSTGDRTVVLTVTDDGGNTNSTAVEFTVTPEAPPEAVIDAPDTVNAGDDLTVNAENSTDNGEIASYEWAFGDGATATGANATHAYENTGTYNVTLTVTDTLGYNATATHNVTVEAPPDNEDPAPNPDPSPSPDPDPSPSPSPSPSPARPSIGLANFSVNTTDLLQGENTSVTAAFHNSGEAAGVQNVQFTVGNYSATEELRLGAGDTKNVTFTHTFDEPGNYTMSLGPRSVAVNVTAAYSEFNVSDTRVRSQELTVGDSAIIEATVTNNGTVAGNHTLNLLMSDGSVVTENVSVEPGETASVAFTPTIETPGEHTVSLGNETYTFSVAAPNATDEPTTSDPGTQTGDGTSTSAPGTDSGTDSGADSGTTTTAPAGGNATSGTTPGFGLVVSLIAVLAAALIAARSH